VLIPEVGLVNLEVYLNMNRTFNEYGLPTLNLNDMIYFNISIPEGINN